MSKYTDELLADLHKCDLTDEMRQSLVDLYREGGNDIEARAMLLQDYQIEQIGLRWRAWVENNKSFQIFIADCHQLSHAWWESHGRKGLHNKEFRERHWLNVMKNKFGWEDTQTIQCNFPGVVIE